MRTDDSRRRSTRRLVPVVLAIACAIVGASGARADSVKDPNAIGCPAAPSGWASMPVVKSVRSPGVVSTNLPESYMSGGNLVSVSCTYFASASERATVLVNYALPSDPNPVSDFFWGCGSGDVAWNAADRVFRAASIDQWAFATFTSSVPHLQARDVSSFTSVTRRLLAGASGYGHPCATVAKPTAVTPSYVFDFTLGEQRVETIFWIELSADGSGTYPIARVVGTAFPLSIAVNGAEHLLTVAYTRGIDYRPATAKTTGQARFTLRVVRSSFPTCRKGASGTLTVTTRPSIELAICGGTVVGASSVKAIRFHQQ